MCYHSSLSVLHNQQTLTPASTSSVCVIATVRLADLMTDNIANPDITWEFANVAIWTVPECAVATISGKLNSTPLLSADDDVQLVALIPALDIPARKLRLSC